MQGTQQEIREIQARLQAINKGDVGYRPPNSSKMVEVFPSIRPPSPSPSQPPTSDYHFELGRTAAPAPESMTQAMTQTLLRQAALGTQTTLGTRTLEAQTTAYAFTGTPPVGRSPSPVYGTYPTATVAPPQQEPVSATEQAALQQLAEVWRQLESKADQVNQLSVAQEAALLELRAIAQRVERDWRATGLQNFPFAEIDGDLSALYGRDSADVPVIERDATGNFVMTQRTLELSKAEREAAMMAEVLRRKRPTRSPVLTPVGQTVWNWFQGLFAGDPSRPKQRRRATATSTLVAQPGSEMSLPKAAAWLFGATLARMAIDAVLVSYPAFWLPAVGLIIAPAAIAAYRTTVAPESSIQWGYRLLLIMVGLLLGGRL